MNLTKIINITNKVALFSVGLLAYWVFIFICITVFGFKVFKENITQGFYFSIAGIFAVLAGAIILNVMLNLTKISEHVDQKEPNPLKGKGKSKIKVALLALSFPLIFSFLYFGDMASSMKKENYLVKSCDLLIKENSHIINELAEYKFNKNYIRKTSNSLKLLSQIDENFPQIRLLLEDSINGKPVFLSISRNHYLSKNETPEKVDYMYSTSKEERKYLRDVFKLRNKDYRFSASDGKYEIYYPISLNNRVFVLYLSDRQRYGKMGS